MAIERFEAQLVDVKTIAPSVKHFTFKKADDSKFHYTPGQFITFLFDHEDGKIRRRSYSVATIPGQGALIEIAISYVEGGIASEKFFNMKVGEKFNAMGPAGRLILKEGETIRKLVLVGTGTGIAPYRSMLPHLEFLLSSHIKAAHILLGVQHQEDMLYAGDFRKYAQALPALTFTGCLSREKNKLATDECLGYVQHCFEKMDLDPDQDIIYLCGNPNMIDDAFELLTQKGFGPKSVRREKYISSN